MGVKHLRTNLRTEIINSGKAIPCKVEQQLDPVMSNKYLGIKFVQLKNNISQKLVPRTILGMEVCSGSTETTNQGINLKFQHSIYYSKC